MSKEVWRRLVGPTALLVTGLGLAACNADGKACNPLNCGQEETTTTQPVAEIPAAATVVVNAEVVTVPVTAATATTLEVPVATLPQPAAPAVPNQNYPTNKDRRGNLEYHISQFETLDGPGEIIYGHQDNPNGSIFVMGAKAANNHKDIVWEGFCAKDGSGNMVGSYGIRVRQDYIDINGFAGLPTGTFVSDICAGPATGEMTLEEAAAWAPSLLPHV